MPVVAAIAKSLRQKPSLHVRTGMKGWSIIIAATLVTAWLLVDTVREFFANETVRYFSSDPYRLLYVAAIGIAGGFAALGFVRLPARAQQQVRVFSRGAAASALTVIGGYFVFCFYSLSSFIAESGNAIGVLFVLLILACIVAYLWLEFYRASKSRVSR